MTTAKQWIEELKRISNARKSRIDDTIYFESNKKKKLRMQSKKNLKKIIRIMKRDLGRKLTASEIKEIKDFRQNNI